MSKGIGNTIDAKNSLSLRFIGIDMPKVDESYLVAFYRTVDERKAFTFIEIYLFECIKAHSYQPYYCF